MQYNIAHPWSQVMHPSNEMFNLHDNVTVEFNYHSSKANRRFYLQHSHRVGVENYLGNAAHYAMCEWTEETEALVNSKTVTHSPPSFDAANFVCHHNLVVHDQMACKQR